MVLAIIRTNPEYTAKQISNIAGKSQRKIEKHIAKLKEVGILVRKGGTYGGYWEINDN
ncbi:MAG: cell filamentation protein Fic [Bacteroidales bacterium 36-12]|nr:MAG: cell filamentation protein Fic [Bacteroidales bacterium 36-12]